jgi:hypothetical protein
MAHLSADEFRDLFEERGPLSDFASKIQVGYAMGLFGPKTKQDLGLIREIRNAFAHSLALISFDTKEIADVCHMLHTHTLAEEFATPIASAEVAPSYGGVGREYGPLDMYLFSCGVITSLIGSLTKRV